MTFEQIIYLVSLSLQLSGALILIFCYWGNTENRVLNSIYSTNSYLHREDDNTVFISKEKFIKAYKGVLQNRISFILIAAGYLFSLFGNADGICSWIGFLVVLVLSILLYRIGTFISCWIAKRKYKKNRVYDYEKLTSILDSEVTTNLTKQEIEDICK